MSNIFDIQEKLQDTNAMIAHLEQQAAIHRNRPSLLVNLKAAQNRRTQLEAEFDLASSKLGTDVCRYRFLMDGGEAKIAFLANVLLDFQAVVSNFYAAVATGPRKVAKLASEILTETALDFAYTYPGSIGFAFTVPNERLLLISSNLDESIRILSQVVKAKTSDEIRNHARQLGPAPIRMLYRWATDHVKANFSAEIEWRRGGEVRSSLLVQQPEFEVLQRVIDETSDQEQTEITVSGLLIAVDAIRKTFRLEPDVGGEVIRGNFSETIDAGHTVEIPKRYTAKLLRTRVIHYSTEEEQVGYELLHLEPLGAGDPVHG